MTIKMVKIPKNKNKQPKQKKVESDSDISDSEAPGNAPKIDKKQLKQISTEVTDLLASLKKEHGIEDETVVVAPKGKDKSNKNKKEAKNAKIVAPAAVKKAKGQQAEKKQLIKQEKSLENENKKQKPFKGSDGVKQEAKPIVAVQPQQNSPKKKKNKNQKRTAENAVVKTEPSEEPPTKKVKQNAAQNQTKKQKQKKNKGDAKPVIKIEPKEEAEESEDAEEESTETEDVAVKKDHHLASAVPVFVGNLPTNIKRLKLLKMFKKFGNVVSIRFRTNNGKKFLRKKQLDKVPHVIAFIYFDTRAAAEASVALNGEKIGENFITVDVDSKEKAANVKPQNTVVVGNLKYAVNNHILEETFKCCGKIEHIRVVQTDKGCKGVAFVRFVKPESCQLALQLNGTSILGREIRVEKYKANKSSAEKEVKKAKTPKPVQKKKIANKATAATSAAPVTGDGDKKKNKKKKEFLGVKSNDAKKAKLNKKKKNKLSNEKRLALKVAPKA